MKSPIAAASRGQRQVAWALRSVGLPESDLPLALLAFNLGVEHGQLAFVLLMLALGRALRRLPLARRPPFRQAPAYLIGSLAAFWFFNVWRSFSDLRDDPRSHG